MTVVQQSNPERAGVGGWEDCQVDTVSESFWKAISIPQIIVSQVTCIW